jgi:hypothetical protein
MFHPVGLGSVHISIKQLSYSLKENQFEKSQQRWAFSFNLERRSQPEHRIAGADQEG